MRFVGRERETKRIIKFLERGTNVILTGKYGIGRTALMKHIAIVTKGRWRFLFVDCSQTPAHIIRQLSAHLLPAKKKGGKRHYIRHKSGRFRIIEAALKIESEDKHSPILVLDNIAKLTSQKLRFIRDLAQDSPFRFVAIVEGFMPKEDWFLLRASLLAEVIILPYLNEESTTELLRHLSEKHALNWSEQRLHMLASQVRGYPLGVHEVVKIALAGKTKDAFG